MGVTLKEATTRIAQACETRLGAELLELWLVRSEPSEDRYAIRWRKSSSIFPGLNYGTHMVLINSERLELLWGHYDQDEAGSEDDLHMRSQ